MTTIYIASTYLVGSEHYLSDAYPTLQAVRDHIIGKYGYLPEANRFADSANLDEVERYEYMEDERVVIIHQVAIRS